MDLSFSRKAAAMLVSAIAVFALVGVFAMPRTALAEGLEAGKLSGQSTVLTTSVTAGSNYANAIDASLSKWNTYNMWSGGDYGTYVYQYFKIRTSSDKSSTYVFKAEYLDGSPVDGQIDEISLQDSNYKVIRKTNLEKTHAAYASDALVLNANTDYYVKVYNYRIAEGANNTTYRFQLNEVIAEPSQPVVAKAKVGKRSVKLSWRGYRADRYKVAYKASGASGWKTKIVSSRNVTLKNLQTGKKYKIKVRGQRYVNGKWYTGKYSATKTTGKIK